MNLTVYTAVFGDYQGPSPPKQTGGASEYICFTDRQHAAKVPLPWKVVTVERKYSDPQRENRFYKWTPHKFLDCEYSIYIDGNISVNVNLRKLVDEYLAIHNIAFYKHPHRDCIYDEAETIINMRKDDKPVVEAHIARVRASGYPAHNGLVAGTYIFRRHTEDVARFNTAVWKAIQSGSKRDQLSINWVLWQLGMSYYEINKPWGPASGEFLYGFR